MPLHRFCIFHKPCFAKAHITNLRQYHIMSSYNTCVNQILCIHGTFYSLLQRLFGNKCFHNFQLLL